MYSCKAIVILTSKLSTPPIARVHVVPACWCDGEILRGKTWPSPQSWTELKLSLAKWFSSASLLVAPAFGSKAWVDDVRPICIPIFAIFQLSNSYGHSVAHRLFRPILELSLLPRSLHTSLYQFGPFATKSGLTTTIVTINGRGHPYRIIYPSQRCKLGGEE